MSRTALNLILCCVFFFFGRMAVSAQNTSLQKQENTFIQPPYLKAGDSVAIVAPSGILKNRRSEVQQAKKMLETWGLEVVVGDNVFNQNNHFAGTDDERCEDFQKVLDNPNIKAIWSARGGYGAVRILDKLDYSKFREQPKWVIGYSDITALHSQVHNLGFESLQAMMCTSLTDGMDSIKETVSTFKAAVFGKPMAYALEGSDYNRTGSASGQLIGGNLTILHTMLGSKTSLDMEGKILFIEEIGEYAYHIDRMLQSLRRAGYFENCNGVIVGNMSKVKKNTTPWGKPVEQLILDALSDYDFPIVFNMPAGHEKDNRALIFGRTIEIKVEKSKSSIVFKE